MFVLVLPPLWLHHNSFFQINLGNCPFYTHLMKGLNTVIRALMYQVG